MLHTTVAVHKLKMNQVVADGIGMIAGIYQAVLDKHSHAWHEMATWNQKQDVEEGGDCHELYVTRCCNGQHESKRVAWARQRKTKAGAKSKDSKSWIWHVDPDIGTGTFKGSRGPVEKWAKENFLPLDDQDLSAVEHQRPTHAYERGMPQALADWAFGHADAMAASQVEGWAQAVSKHGHAVMMSWDAHSGAREAELLRLLSDINAAKVLSGFIAFLCLCPVDARLRTIDVVVPMCAMCIATIAEL